MKRVAVVTVAAAAIAVALDRWFAAPRHQGPPSDHFDGRRFHNHQSGWQSEGSFLRWQLTKKPGPWRDWIDDPPGPKPPPRVDDLRVTFINHATTLIQIDGLNILTDPIWSDRCSPVSWAGPKRHRPPGIRFEDLPRIDAILISHNHYDHLDLPTLRRFRPLPVIISHLGNGQLLAKNGLDGAVEIDWWEEHRLSENVRVTSVPAQHFSARAMSDRDHNLWGGFVISGPAGNVYFAGDTGWGKHFEEIGKRFAPIRLALLPIGAYLPRWFMKPAHITPAEAVDAHRVLGASTSVAMHFGTFRLGDDGETQPVDDLRRAIAEKNNPRIWVLGFGEGRDVPAPIRRGADAPLDAATIESLRKLSAGNTTFLAELLDLYLEDAPPRLEAIERAIRAGDATGLSDAAHGLKSSSGNIGATRVRELAEALETMGRRGDLAGAESVAARLRDAYDHATESLRQMVG